MSSANDKKCREKRKNRKDSKKATRGWLLKCFFGVLVKSSYQ